MERTTTAPQVAIDLCNAIQQIMSEHGSIYEFLDKSGRDIGVAIKIFPSGKTSVRHALVNAIEDDNFSETLLKTLDDGQKEVVEHFISEFRLFQKLEPFGSEWFVSFLYGVPNEIFDLGIPRRVNSFSGQYSRMTLDAFSENIFVKTITKLVLANKSLGGDRFFVRSDPLTSVLLSVSALLASLRPQESEIEVLRIPASRDVHKSLSDVLDDIEKEAKKLREALNKLKA